jgi:imidazolonepropionase-like amidohydrolase
MDMRSLERHRHGRRLARFVCLIACFPACFAAAAPAADRPVAIVGATVHPVSGPAIVEATVILRAGKIEAIRAGAQGAVPADAERIDGSGLDLYPAFINANTVLGLTEIGSVRGTVDIAEVGSLNPNVRAEVAINPSSELMPVTRANGVLLALTAPQGGLIAGTSALIALNGWTWEEMTVRAPVAMHVNWPAMGIDRGPQAKKEEDQVEAREMAIRELRDAFAAAAAYWRSRQAEGSRGVPRHDEDVVWAAMRPVVERKIPVVVEADELMQIRAALDWTEAEGLDLILAGGLDAWHLAPELASRRIPVILQPVNRLPRRAYEPYDIPYTNAAKLHAAGVPVLFSTGTSGSGAANARNLPYEAAKAVAFGLPREAAIRALTLTAAETFGVADRLGSIEPGKDASLILVEGDPLEITSQVRRAWIQGRELDLSNRHQQLYEKYDARPKPAVLPASAAAAPPPRTTDASGGGRTSGRAGGAESGEP